MSVSLVFVYDYHLARDIIGNICCMPYKKHRKAWLEDISVTYRGDFTQGFIHIERGGNDKIEGIIFKMQDRDIDRLQKYIDIHYKTKRVKTNVKTGVKTKEKVITFIPEQKQRLNTPDKSYLEKLVLAYKENKFDEHVIFKALAKTVAIMYPEMRREYRFVRKEVENEGSKT